MLLSEIVEHLNGILYGDPNCQIDALSSITEAKSGDITFIFDKKYHNHIKTSAASAFIVTEKLNSAKNQILIKDAKTCLGKVINLFAKNLTPPFSDISDKAIIDPSCTFHKSSAISHFSVIGANTTIAEQTYIYSNVTIGQNCIIGNNCIIYPNVTIYDNTKIGNNVIIHANATIGADGFGYSPNGEQWTKIPHIGSVIIEDNVEVGANTCIDRGCLGETHIQKGTKIDNLVQIGHNCKIGQNCIIVSQVGISGSVTLGDHVVIGGQVGFTDHVSVGSNSYIMARAGISKNFPEDSILSGVPAMPYKQHFKENGIIKRLVKEYEKKRPKN